jgi:glycerophosphoryl diester phosphodiesterase
MRNRLTSFALATAIAVLALGSSVLAHDGRDDDGRDCDQSIQLGPRPFYLVDGMDSGWLKSKLSQCKAGPFYRTDFSIGHRGAALQFPEHSKEAYNAGARMGAGIVECDTTFTRDGRLVCRHSECDLHTTTNIVATPLNDRCTVPWTGPGQTPAPKCCTSDLTLAEFKTLRAKMDASNPAATTAEGYLGGTASWRTDLYTGRGTLMTLRESIALNERNGVKHTPELKGGDPKRIEAIFGGQDGYAQEMIDVLRESGVDPHRVWLQSFDIRDVLYWIKNAPEFGRQAVYLDSYDLGAGIKPLTRAQLKALRDQGVRIFAPPMNALLAVSASGEIVPSQYALDIKNARLKIITWTFERADLRQGASKAGFYYDFDPQGKAVKKDSDMYKALDVLARQVGILGIFSDWPATVTYYANCMGLK